MVCFLLLENFTWILEPTFFGKLLDALIDRFYKDELKMNLISKIPQLGEANMPGEAQ